MRKPIADCAWCGEVKRISGRGLCDACYQLLAKYGGLDEYERKGRPAAETVEELRHFGLDDRLPIKPQLRSLAPQIGMTFPAVERAWLRHKKRTAA